MSPPVGTWIDPDEDAWRCGCGYLSGISAKAGSLAQCGACNYVRPPQTPVTPVTTVRPSTAVDPRLAERAQHQAKARLTRSIHDEMDVRVNAAMDRVTAKRRHPSEPCPKCWAFYDQGLGRPCAKGLNSPCG